VEIRAYCPKRWPGKAFEPEEARVSKIDFFVIDGRTNAGKAMKQGVAIVPQDHIEGPPEDMVADLAR
jgi:hypothetical protein